MFWKEEYNCGSGLRREKKVPPCLKSFTIIAAKKEKVSFDINNVDLKSLISKATQFSYFFFFFFSLFTLKESFDILVSMSFCQLNTGSILSLWKHPAKLALHETKEKQLPWLKKNNRKKPLHLQLYSLFNDLTHGLLFPDTKLRWSACGECFVLSPQT